MEQQLNEWVLRLRKNGDSDPRATYFHVRSIVSGALAGGRRLDDIIRGETTLLTGVWLLAALLDQKWIRISDDGTVHPADRKNELPPAPPTALVDPNGANGLIDWSELGDVLDNRPYEPSAEYFQSFDTFDTLRRRLAIMNRYGDLTGRTVLQVGDDEMFSVVLAMVDDVSHVHVVDADPRVLDAVSAEAEARELDITTHQIDILVDRLPSTCADTFFISGLKDAGGLLLFITSTLASISSPNVVGYISYDPDVYRPGYTEAAAHRELLSTLERLDCSVTAVMPCDELALSADFTSELVDTIRAAPKDAPPAVLRSSLRDLVDSPKADLFAHKEGFPDVPLRPTPLVRVETGQKSASSAKRYRRFLQSAIGG